MKKTVALSSALAIVVGLAVPAVAAEQAPRKTVGRLDTNHLADIHPDMAYAIADQAQAQATNALQESAYTKAAKEAARSKAEAQAAATPTAKPTSMPDLPEGTPAWVIAINWAQTKLGNKYVWGGDGYDNPYDGYDCSGLTLAAYKQAGITLPRVANDQYAASDNHPSRSQLRPGDLVFYGHSARGIHHVGLYVGNGMMLHAPNRQSVIRFDRVDYMSDYYGATRVS